MVLSPIRRGNGQRFFSGSSSGFSSSRFGGRSSSFNSGRDWVASWEEGESSLTWSQAQSWCGNRNMRAVVLDNSSKVQRFLNILTGSGRPYYWTGGEKTGDAGVSWSNGRVYPSGRGWPWWEKMIIKLNINLIFQGLQEVFMEEVNLMVDPENDVSQCLTSTFTVMDPISTISGVIIGSQSFANQYFKVLVIPTMYLVSYNEYIMCQVSLSLVLSISSVLYYACWVDEEGSWHNLVMDQ